MLLRQEQEIILNFHDSERNLMSQLVKPHGTDCLKPLLLTGETLLAAQHRALTLPKLPLTSREMGDLIMLGLGGFTPLSGFMNYADWQSVCENYTLENGVFWAIPITLSTPQTLADSLHLGDEIALINPEDQEILGILTLREKYRIDKNYECQHIFRTTETAHPGVQMVWAQGEVNLAGEVQVLSQGHFPRSYPNLFLTPAETRALFIEKNWRTIAAFQTRNPMHRSHEYLVKIAIEVCDGVLIHSLLGKLKPGDIPAEVRTEAIAALTEHYFVPDTVIQAGYPLDMRYAGPREALLHAIFRQNYGCSHLIVGRDHAGVGTYYGAFDAQHIFNEIPQDALEIKPLKIDLTFWCYRCGGMVSQRTCPHDETARLSLSGTKLRELLATNQPIPPEFSRPEVLDILRRHYAHS
jgi:sulfate adenylyltransferase